MGRRGGPGRGHGLGGVPAVPHHARRGVHRRTGRSWRVRQHGRQTGRDGDQQQLWLPAGLRTLVRDDGLHEIQQRLQTRGRADHGVGGRFRLRRCLRGPRLARFPRGVAGRGRGGRHRPVQKRGRPARVVRGSLERTGSQRRHRRRVHGSSRPSPRGRPTRAAPRGPTTTSLRSRQLSVQCRCA